MFGYSRPASADPEHGVGTIAIDAPYKLVVDRQPIIERFIRVLDAGGVLITVIEFISPAGQEISAEPGLEAYREKLAELLAAGVHVVEFDLVRAGSWRR